LNNRLYQFNLNHLQHYRLENGLTILALENRSAPTVTCMIWYRAGSRCDPNGAAGTAHFLEHMMFKGTKRFPKGEIDYVTALNGGFNNGFTSYDFTAFCFSFASDRWWTALEIEADRMKQNLFDPKDLEIERQVILEELRMEMDEPWEILREAVTAKVFPAHPYRFPVAGLIEEVEKISGKQLIDLYRNFYVPNNAVLVLVGAFETGAAIERIHQLFDPISPRKLSPTCFTQQPQYSSRRLRVEKQSSVARMVIALPAPRFSDSDFIVLEVLDQLLSGGKLSRLQSELVEENQFASLLSSEYSESLDPYLYNFRLEIREGISPDLVEEIFFQQIQELRETPVSDEELNRARLRTVVQYIGDLETTFDQAFHLGLAETLGRSDQLHGYIQRLSSVTADEISHLANLLLDREKATIALLERSSGSSS
jgi:zinc protease